MSDPIAISVRRAMELAPIGKTKLYLLMKTGQLKSTTVLGRRMIDYRSFMELLLPTSVPTNLSRPPENVRERPLLRSARKSRETRSETNGCERTRTVTSQSS